MRTINADELKANLHKWFPQYTLEGIEAKTLFAQILADIDNTPTVAQSCKELQEVASERPQGEYVPINKLRLMTVEECAGHTIDYAMGWKACIDWLKKGGAE